MSLFLKININIYFYILLQYMEDYTTVLLYAIPCFIILMLIEIGYGHLTNKQTHRALDTISSLSSGITNIIKDSLGLIVVIISYPLLFNHLAVFDITSSWIVYLIAFICIDFASYWNHRLCHKINFFWNQHVIHHSSEEFNLACALRQSISTLLGYFSILLIPAAIAGVPHKVIVVLAPIHLFSQFWYHTKHIGKLGFLEFIIVTPSQHRVHHAINKEYIDKNLGAIFCVWDRMFGSFQEELESVTPVYGVLKPVRSWNPIIINFQHLWQLTKDAYRTKHWPDKLKLWFMPTGWRPQDVVEKYPIATIDFPENQKKYKTNPSKSLIVWSFLQLITSLFLMLFLFYNFSYLETSEALIYGSVIFFGIYGYTSLMDKDNISILAVSLFSGLGLFVINNSNDWFGLSNYMPNSNYFMVAIFSVTFLGTCYFAFFEKNSEQPLQKN